MPQLSIDDSPGVGYAGQLTEGMPHFSRSCRAEGSSVVAGMPVKRGTNAEKQVEPFSGGDTVNLETFGGVVVLETSRPEGGIDDGGKCSVLRFGSILMDFAEGVTAGEMVTVTLANGDLKGVAQGTAAGSIPTGDVVLPGLRVAETTTGAGLAEVEVNLYGVQPDATVGSAT